MSANTVPCPYCKHPNDTPDTDDEGCQDGYVFGEDDDTPVCSECGEPYYVTASVDISFHPHPWDEADRARFHAEAKEMEEARLARYADWSGWESFCWAMARIMEYAHGYTVSRMYPGTATGSGSAPVLPAVYAVQEWFRVEHARWAAAERAEGYARYWARPWP